MMMSTAEAAEASVVGPETPQSETPRAQPYMHETWQTLGSCDR